jgi:hypothetical protein
MLEERESAIPFIGCIKFVRRREDGACCIDIDINRVEEK